ncbi:hypothetical protein [Algibacter pectinivorans]|uniref:Lipoprotein n=1 Tax=Algibacter pectinivorans TaxID=870482 RepID=A0A1I1NE73_9FLAO|nr:hypothetical protein [Algibacter pectinivorans]SFC93063.1 hypothetical protein SAMN04487987_10237 [Algibacter pectinivorans]
MKSVLLILLASFTVLTSCKNDSKSENQNTSNSSSEEKTVKQNDGLTHLKGEFVYYDGAAVLQTHANIYGVLITDKLKELDKQAQQYKSEPTDMVLVEIRGKITNQKDEKILWENKVEVMEILNVKPTPKEDNKVIKLEN